MCWRTGQKKNLDRVEESGTCYIQTRSSLRNQRNASPMTRKPYRRLKRTTGGMYPFSWSYLPSCGVRVNTVVFAIIAHQEGSPG